MICHDLSNSSLNFNLHEFFSSLFQHNKLLKLNMCVLFILLISYCESVFDALNKMSFVITCHYTVPGDVQLIKFCSTILWSVILAAEDHVVKQNSKL